MPSGSLDPTSQRRPDSSVEDVIPADWTPHRRDDGELVGWVRPEGDEWTAVDLLGREASGAVDWLEAEEALETRGIAWLGDVWMLEHDTETLRVRIVEVSPGGSAETGRVVVKVEDFGAVGGPPTPRFELAWPAPETLRPPRPGDPLATPWG